MVNWLVSEEELPKRVDDLIAKVTAQSKPTLKESASQGDEEEDDDAAPKTAKERTSAQKSKQDEAAAKPGMRSRQR